MTLSPLFEAYLGSTVTIPRPMPSVLPRGEKADKVFDQCAVSVRMTKDQREVVEEAAALLGMKLSEFMRWCSYRAAIVVSTKHDEFEKRNSR